MFRPDGPCLLLLLAILFFCCEPAMADGYVSNCGQTRCTSFRVNLDKNKLVLLNQDEFGLRFGNALALQQWGINYGKRVRKNATASA